MGPKSFLYQPSSNTILRHIKWEILAISSIVISVVQLSLILSKLAIPILDFLHKKLVAS